MKIKTQDLAGLALDWAVAKLMYPEDIGNTVPFSYDGSNYSPSTKWGQGGPIIEREEIAVQCCYSDGKFYGWMADSKKLNEDDDMEQYGPTPLIAAMRCYVIFKLGAEIDVPDEVMGEKQ